MTDTPGTPGGFNRPRPATTPHIAREYDRLGLGEAPSLEDIEPVAIKMMSDKRIIEAMGLVLGRRIDARETLADPDLLIIGQIALQDPEKAFGGLLMLLTIEELEAER
jgi:hypothetical protein